MDYRLEVVVIPVSDVDRARDFYRALGWRLDADFPVGEGFRVVQMTPPGSACSIIFGTGLTPLRPARPRACSWWRTTSPPPGPSWPAWARRSATSSTTPPACSTPPGPTRRSPARP